MQGRVLDLGCSDPGFFDAILPEGCTAAGVGANDTVADWARLTGRYAEVGTSPGYTELGAEASVDHVFARGTLVHVKDLDATLAAVRRTLRPDGTFLCSVITHRYAEWGLMPRLFEICGYPDIGKELRQKHQDFHAIHHATSVPGWRQRFTAAGFELLSCTPVLPRFNAQANLLFDLLWHVPTQAGGELGDHMAAYLSARPAFRTALRGAINALLELENDWEDTAGAVFELRRARWRGLSIFRR
jgi:SAM-dependent methyltransferase